MLRIFPPVKKQLPKGYWRSGLSESHINSCWGKVSVRVQRIKTKTGKRKQIYLDACLDESGWSPEALERLLELSSRLSYEESSHLAKRFGLEICSSSLESLTSSYSQTCQKLTHSLLCQESEETVPQHSNRIMVLQIDGVYVLGQPQAGHCPGLEIKSAVLYPEASPTERWMLADRCSAEDFLPMLSGLLKQAKLSPKDTLIGLGDGAAWIDNTFYHLDALRITDVYHAVEYLEIIMQTMNWDDSTRTYHRKQWCKAQLNVRDWLTQYLPDPEIWLTWSQDAQTACLYLENRLDSMDYFDFNAKGFPIGSGQVEAMNKNVIGHRMKRSGMHWSESGAAGMASLRAQVCAKHSFLHFDNSRFHAFTLPDFIPA